MVYKKEPTKKERYAKLKSIKDNLENGYRDNNGILISPDKDVQLYLKWKQLTPIDRAQAYSEWDQHYKDSRKTKEHLLFQEMREALRMNNTAKVRELASKSVANLSESEKPKSISPYAISNSSKVLKYKQIVQELFRLERESKEMEFSGVF